MTEYDPNDPALLEVMQRKLQQITDDMERSFWDHYLNDDPCDVTGWEWAMNAPGYTNAASIYNAASTSDPPVTIESIRAAMEKGRRLMDEVRANPNHYDVIVMTTAVFERIQAHTTDVQPGMSLADRLCGLPVYHYPTEMQCKRKAWELMQAGKKVMLVTDQPQE